MHTVPENKMVGGAQPLSHGHVYPSSMKVRCGGPALCTACALELANAPDDVRRRYYEEQDRQRGGRA